MIISASRRTDIPAFYSRWFFNRLEEGFVMVQNPMNPNMVSRVSLDPDSIDCIVFWTKNPANMMKNFHRLKDYRFYFLFTLTSYGSDLERQLEPKETIIDTFIRLSEKIGKHRVVWRYDPILLSASIDESYHFRHVEAMARRLQNHTDTCIISFLDMYKKCERNLTGFNVKAPDTDSMLRMAGQIAHIAGQYDIGTVTCAESIDFTKVGVKPAQCIDEKRISRICDYSLEVKKDPHQRKMCNCVQSIDIGAYNTCNHICLYCYANSDAPTVRQNMKRHNPLSPLLLGELTGKEKITKRKIDSSKRP